MTIMYWPIYRMIFMKHLDKSERVKMPAKNFKLNCEQNSAPDAFLENSKKWLSMIYWTELSRILQITCLRHAAHKGKFNLGANTRI